MILRISLWCHKFIQSFGKLRIKRSLVWSKSPYSLLTISYNLKRGSVIFFEIVFFTLSKRILISVSLLDERSWSHSTIIHWYFLAILWNCIDFCSFSLFSKYRPTEFPVMIPIATNCFRRRNQNNILVSLELFFICCNIKCFLHHLK